MIILSAKLLVVVTAVVLSVEFTAILELVSVAALADMMILGNKVSNIFFKSIILFMY